jgi:hypothetical protein
MYIIDAEQLLKHRHKLPLTFTMSVTEVHLRGERWYQLLGNPQKTDRIVTLIRAYIPKYQVRIYQLKSLDDQGNWKRV